MATYRSVCPRAHIFSIGRSVRAPLKSPRSPVLFHSTCSHNLALLSTSLKPHRHYSAVPTTTIKPKPIICIGKHAHIALAGREVLQPEYDYIHVILTLPQGLHDLPFLKAGTAPPPFTGEETEDGKPRSAVQQVGSQDYGERAIAVVVGGGFGDKAVERLLAATGDKNGERRWQIPWLRVDKKKTVGNPGIEGEAYGLQVGGRAKEELERLEREGLLGKEGVYRF